MSNEPQPPRPIICWGSQAHSNLQALLAFETIFIAYSGGIDSHVLLHLCATYGQLKTKLTAVYINHGLQKEAEAWGKHCESICNNLGVRFMSIAVNAAAESGESPEEAARNARYAALKPLLGKNDVLLLAQHRDDQLETVLLQLFRGSGLKGLSGMPETIPFGAGILIRPLLAHSKAEIVNYAGQHALQWIEDPTNRHARFDRNFLRNDIIPLLKQRWSSLDKTVSRSARHCAEAQAIIDAMADALFEDVFDVAENTLVLDKFKTCSTSEQSLVIRQWFVSLGLKIPSQDVVQRIVRQIVMARADADPVLSTQNRQIRRYRNRLYAVMPDGGNAAETVIWLVSDSILKLSDNRIYEIVAAECGIPQAQWQNAEVTVKFRSGGELLSILGREGHHSLKNLYQEAGIPPWERTKTPLIYLDGQLAAVGEYWIDAGFYSTKPEPCFKVIRHKIYPKDNDGIVDVV